MYIKMIIVEATYLKAKQSKYLNKVFKIDL